MRNASQSPSSETGQQFSTATIAGTTALSVTALHWAKKERGISRATLEALCVASGMIFFPELEAKSEALFFKYPEGWKARSFPAKSFVAGKGFRLDFWNIETVLKAGPSRVYIAEGEFDCLALVQAGISPDCVLSVPNGARERPAENPQEMRGYAYVIEAIKAGLSRVREFVWVGDADAPGKVLREDMVRIIGAARFRFVDWPEGIHDANDMLKKDGPEALLSLVQEGSLPWPVSGLFRMSALPEPPPLQVWEPGFPEWENKVRFAPRTMSVVTGHPGMGKTVLFSQIWFQIVERYGVPCAMASFETRPRPHIRRQIRSLYLKKLERDMTDKEKRAADGWLDERYVFMVHPDNRPTLGWFLDCAEVAVVRHGCRIVTLDPWNRLEGDRAHGESETDYIGRCLRELYSFAHDMNCHVQVLAHPAKMDGANRGKAPILEDISGSKHWDNMVDQGFVVHRQKLSEGKERSTDAILFHRKARFEELGYPCKLDLRYDLAKAKFVSTDYEM
jgi:twinkle protein